MTLCGSVVQAHVINQIYGRFSADTETWIYDITFDIGLVEGDALDEEEPQKPRSFLLELSEEQHALLRAQAEELVRGLFSITPSGYEISFPDYETSPPDFPKLLNGGAYISVELRGQTPEKGDLVMTLADGDWPNVVIGRGPAGQAATIMLTVWAGQSETLMTEAEIAQAATIGTFGAPEEVTTEAKTDWLGLLESGFRHVLPEGLDHILFILAICVGCTTWRQLLTSSLVFTMAHSVTLGLVAAGKFSAPGWVEPVIAGSIIAMALVGERRAFRQMRYTLIFGLGLVHGMGFGSVMMGYFLETSLFLPTLAVLNLGVELAQIVVICLFVLAAAISRRLVTEKSFRVVMRLLIIPAGFYLLLTR